MGNAKSSHPFRATNKTSEYASLLAEIESIRRSLIDLETSSLTAIARTLPVQRKSARNLLHYIALRQHDLRPLQTRLSRLGLSSFGRSEACVLAILQAVETLNDILCRMQGHQHKKRSMMRKLKLAKAFH